MGSFVMLSNVVRFLASRPCDFLSLCLRSCSEGCDSMRVRCLFRTSCVVLIRSIQKPHTRSSQYLCIILYDDSCSFSIQLFLVMRFRCDFSSALPASVHLITDPSLRTVPKFVTFSVDSQSSGSPSEVSVMHKHAGL